MVSQLVKKVGVLGVVLFSLFGASQLNGAVLKLDKSHSEVGFSVKHLMISNVKGKFLEYDASIDYDTATQKFQKFEAYALTETIDTNNEKRDEHLRSADFFEVEKFPKMSFVMTSYEIDGDEGKLIGELTIKDITKKVTFKVENNGLVKDPWGNTRIGFTMEGKIDRKEFGLTWNKALEAGGVLVGDQVKMVIEVEAFVK